MSKKASSPPPKKPTTNPPASRREQLRARQAEQARSETVRRWAMLGAFTLAAVLIVALVVWGITRTNQRSTSDSPNASGNSYAISVGQPDAAVTVAIYQDFMCPYCGQFERANRDDIEELVDDGTAQVQLHLMNFLDPQSQGTNYSTRAASALLAVADAEPEHVLAFNAALYDNQPTEGSTGLSDSQLADLARQVGVSEAVYSTFPQAANTERVNQSNQAALDDGISSTPTIRINGDDLPSQQIFTRGALKSAVRQAAGR